MIHSVLRALDWYTRFVGILVAGFLFIAFFVTEAFEKDSVCLIYLALFVAVVWRVMNEWLHYLNRTSDRPDFGMFDSADAEIRKNEWKEKGEP